MWILFDEISKRFSYVFLDICLIFTFYGITKRNGCLETTANILTDSQNPEEFS
jgi:hypothetical protein